MFLEVINAQHIREYQILIEFNNGEKRIVDLSRFLEGDVFQPLRDKEYFKSFTIKFNTIEWNNGADFAPEFLYSISKKQS